mgnify:CR=1 FL=1
MHGLRAPVSCEVPPAAIDAWFRSPTAQFKLRQAQEITAKDFRDWKKRLQSIVLSMYKKVCWKCLKQIGYVRSCMFVFDPMDWLRLSDGRQFRWHGRQTRIHRSFSLGL